MLLEPRATLLLEPGRTAMTSVAQELRGESLEPRGMRRVGLGRRPRSVRTPASVSLEPRRTLLPESRAGQQ